MKITIVRFKAFDREFTEYFLDKSYEDIHQDLYSRCNTYTVLHVLQATGAQFQPLICLTKYTNQ